MMLRKWHRVFGYILFLPLCVWAITGAVFIFQPGYKTAFERLEVKTYPYAEPITFTPSTQWRQIRMVSTVLGQHLIAQTPEGWQRYHYPDLTPVAEPTELAVRRLLTDMVSDRSERYGQIIAVNGLKATTSTGVHLTLNWHTLGVQQEGDDTRFINRLYQAHYMQWLGNKPANQAFAGFLLFALTGLVVLGLSLVLTRPRRSKPLGPNA